MTAPFMVDRWPRLGRTTAGVLAVVGMLLLSGSLMALSPLVARGSVIHACYNRGNGTLRWAPSGHCRRGEAVISWNLAGPAGVKGAVGAPGEHGVQGIAGATGKRGERGEEGESPIPGLTGATGAEVPGPPGPTGLSGAPGAAGTEKGSAGVNGQPGVAGATGPMGPEGPKPTGSVTTGPTGPTGAALPGTLAPGKSETGVWIVTSPHTTVLPQPVSLNKISFPVPLAGKLSAPATGCPAVAICHAKQINLKETEEIAEGKKAMPGCKAVAGADPKLLEEPVAEAGNLCVYTGVEEVENNEKTGILNVLGESGSSPTGAWVGYEDNLAGVPGYVRAQGSWAVEG